MARLQDYTETLTAIQNRLLAVDRDKKEALRRVDSLLNRVAAAEKAAAGAATAFQDLFKETEELRLRVFELETQLGTTND